MTRRRQEWSPGAAGPVLRLVDPDPGTSHWWDFAACFGADDAAFFPGKGGPTSYAKRLCARCPVQPQCLEDALEYEATHDGYPYGVWGGKSPEERKTLLKQREQEAA